jgi:hypothetical protein
VITLLSSIVTQTKASQSYTISRTFERFRSSNLALQLRPSWSKKKRLKKGSDKTKGRRKTRKRSKRKRRKGKLIKKKERYKRRLRRRQLRKR